jgi:hypothetical protein
MSTYKPSQEKYSENRHQHLRQPWQANHIDAKDQKPMAFRCSKMNSEFSRDKLRELPLKYLGDSY